MRKKEYESNQEENRILEQMLQRKIGHIERVRQIIDYIEEHSDVISNLVVAYDIETIAGEEITHTYWTGNKNACIGLTDGLIEDIKEEQFLVRSAQLYNDSDDEDDAVTEN